MQQDRQARKNLVEYHGGYGVMVSTMQLTGIEKPTFHRRGGWSSTRGAYPECNVHLSSHIWLAPWFAELIGRPCKRCYR